MPVFSEVAAPRALAHITQSNRSVEHAIYDLSFYRLQLLLNLQRELRQHWHVFGRVLFLDLKI